MEMLQFKQNHISRYTYISVLVFLEFRTLAQTAAKTTIIPSYVSLCSADTTCKPGRLLLESGFFLFFIDGAQPAVSPDPCEETYISFHCVEEV